VALQAPKVHSGLQMHPQLRQGNLAVQATVTNQASSSGARPKNDIGYAADRVGNNGIGHSVPIMHSSAAYSKRDDGSLSATATKQRDTVDFCENQSFVAFFLRSCHTIIYMKIVLFVSANCFLRRGCMEPPALRPLEAFPVHRGNDCCQFLLAGASSEPPEQWRDELGLWLLAYLGCNGAAFLAMLLLAIWQASFRQACAVNFRTLCLVIVACGCFCEAWVYIQPNACYSACIALQS